MTLQEIFLGGGGRGVGAKENLGARLEKNVFFPLPYFNAIESVPLEKCSNNVTKLATRGSIVENRHN
jgi:hypothetical protein